MSTVRKLIWLTQCKGITAAKTDKLLKLFSGIDEIYDCDKKGFLQRGVSEKDADALSDKNTDTADRIIEDCAKLGYGIVTIEDEEFPLRLKSIHACPPVIYVNGKLFDVDSEPLCAVAGTRRCTDYGYRTAEKLGADLARYGFTTVSGLASGVDTAAAKGALSQNGRVVGVIGSGLDIVYPHENRELFASIPAAGGLIVSEYPPHTKTSPWNFPARNRILSGLSLGSVIIEAPEKSGALITAARAVEQGRDVFVFPGNADMETCRGSNRLLKEGAIPTTSAEDIVSEYIDRFPDKIRKTPLESVSAREERPTLQPQNTTGMKKSIDKPTMGNYSLNLTKLGLNETEFTLCQYLAEHGVTHIDTLIEASGVPVAKVTGALTVLEIKGIVNRTNGKFFDLTKKR